MKKNIIITLVGLSLLMAAGCSQGEEQTGVAAPNKSETNISEQDATTSELDKEEAQAREERERMGVADIYGKVTRIVGNEVTVALVEMPEVAQGANDGTESKQRSTGAGMGGPPDGGGMMEVQYTGETKQLTIPVGIPINSRSREGNEELEISDITAGAMIMIWNNESGYPIRVQLMGMR